MKRTEFLAGVRAELPILLGVIPFGLIFGVLAIGAGLPPALAQAMSFIVFAGSAQFIAIPLLGAGVGTAVLWLTTFIVNVRHMLYSASLAPRTQHLPQRWRWLLAYLLTDEAYVVTILHYNDDTVPNTHKHYFLLGAGVTLWTTWQISTAVGIFLGAQVPNSWGLDFTLALTFIGMVIPVLKDRPSVAAALAAGLVAVIANPLPYKMGLMLAAVTGIVVGLLAEGRGAKGEERKSTPLASHPSPFGEQP
ncbi:MAG: AzlC family ABC transporter permease [Ardenticatenaceae bacterium]|nr:AzlC family ABC transporter permease [Ardenticatenaceae bacterium]